MTRLLCFALALFTLALGTARAQPPAPDKSVPRRGQALAPLPTFEPPLAAPQADAMPAPPGVYYRAEAPADARQAVLYRNQVYTAQLVTAACDRCAGAGPRKEVFKQKAKRKIRY